MVFISTSYDSASVLAIKADGKGDVTDTHVAWTLKKGAPHTPSMLLVGDELYMVSDGGLGSCVDAKTGKVHWQKRLGGNGYSASPIYADGKIWFLSEDGVGTVVKAGKTSSRSPATRSASGRWRPTPRSTGRCSSARQGICTGSGSANVGDQDASQLRPRRTFHRFPSGQRARDRVLW